MHRNVLVVGGMVISAAVGPFSCRGPDEAHLAIREVLLNSQSVGETSTLLASPVSWHFDRDGSFAATALTGRPSWSVTGTWKETPDGHISLDGVTDHHFDAKQRGLSFKTIIVGVEVIERSQPMIWVRFAYSEPEGNERAQPTGEPRDRDRQ